jgi:hypothetical protein
MAMPLVLNRQKQDIVKALEKAGHVPSAFAWSDISSDQLHECQASKISHRSEEYFFQIDQSSSSNWIVTYCPADKKWVQGPESYGNWNNVVRAAESWAEFVAGELEAKGYLAIAMNSPQLIHLPSLNEENTPFSKSEQATINSQLNSIEEQLLNLRSDDELFRIEVKRNIDFLRDEVVRSGRTAFRYALFGAILSIGLAFLGPEETKQIIDFAARQLNSASQLVIDLS